MVVSGTVDTTTAGTYTLHYDVTDSSGNNAIRQVRTINVVDYTAEEKYETKSPRYVANMSSPL